MKTKKKSMLNFEKKALTELQQEERINLQGGKDTRYIDHDRFKYLKIPKAGE